jgi:hypothetical protein
MSTSDVDLDPNPHESGSRRAKMAHKNKDISTFEVLDVLF